MAGEGFVFMIFEKNSASALEASEDILDLRYVTSLIPHLKRWQKIY